MAVKFSSSSIKNFKVGGSQVKKLMMNNVQVWPITVQASFSIYTNLPQSYSTYGESNWEAFDVDFDSNSINVLNYGDATTGVGITYTGTSTGTSGYTFEMPNGNFTYDDANPLAGPVVMDVTVTLDSNGSIVYYSNTISVNTYGSSGAYTHYYYFTTDPSFIVPDEPFTVTINCIG